MSTHSFTMRSSIGYDSMKYGISKYEYSKKLIVIGKKSKEKENVRSVSATRQTIMGYRPNEQRSSSSVGRESLIGLRQEMSASLGIFINNFFIYV